MNRLIRNPRNFRHDNLPLGPFECRLRADESEDQVAIWTKNWMIKKKQKNEANGVTPRERKRIGRIREKYKNVSKALPEQEVITKIAVLHLLGRISELNHFDRC